MTYTTADKRKRIFAIFAASSGNLVEWFDFYIYAFCAVYFAHIFFPEANPTVQLLNTAGIFAVGFLMRPIGGWIFGRIADRHGRKKSLVISVMMMCVGSLMIACLPGYDAIGIWAPALLVVARLLQGLSVGGQYGTAATYMSEIVMKGQRGFYSSFQYVTLIGGQLLAVLVILILQQLLNESQMREWGWRIPFIIGAFAGVFVLLLNKTLTETAPNLSEVNKDAGSLRVLFRDHKKAFFTVLGYTAGGSLSFYTFTTYMQKYLVNSANMSINTASAVMTGCLLVFMLMQPLFGALSDRIGRRNNMLLFGGLGTLFTVPIMLLLQGVSEGWIAFLLITFALAIVSLYSSISGIVKAEMFPTEIRALGVSLSYAIANAIFGGTAEFIALSFKAGGYESLFYWYVTGVLVLAFLVSFRLPRKPPYLLNDY
jgi:MHS family alpha-ketoglutarate permease-like MFS transporter